MNVGLAWLCWLVLQIAHALLLLPQKLESRVHLGQLAAGVSDHIMDSLDGDDFSMTNKVATALRVGVSKRSAVGGRARDKSDRATVEQVSE